MKKVIAVVVVVIILVVVGIMMFLGPKEQIITPPPPPSTVWDSESIEIQPRERFNRATRVFVDTRWPVILNLKDYQKQEIINNKIFDSINPYIDEINVVSEGVTSIVNNDNLMDTKQYHYNVDYERFDNDRYLTLVITQEIKISLGDSDVGGLRSNKWKDTYTVDCETSDQVYLKDICGFANYKSIILDEVNKQARANNYELVGGSELMQLSDTQRYYIKDKKLIIYFEPASIAPYLLGELEFEMPFTYDDSSHKFVR